MIVHCAKISVLYKSAHACSLRNHHGNASGILIALSIYKEAVISRNGYEYDKLKSYGSLVDVSALCFITPRLAEPTVLWYNLFSPERKTFWNVFAAPGVSEISKSSRVSGSFCKLRVWGDWRPQAPITTRADPTFTLRIWFLKRSSIQAHVTLTTDAVLRGANHTDESADRLWPRVEQVRRLGHCKAAEYVHLEPQIWSKYTSTWELS